MRGRAVIPEKEAGGQYLIIRSCVRGSEVLPGGSPLVGQGLGPQAGLAGGR